MNTQPILHLDDYRRRLQMRERFLTETEYQAFRDTDTPTEKHFSLPLSLWVMAYLYGGMLSFLIGVFLRQQEIMHMGWVAIAGIGLGCWIVLGLVVAKLFGEMARED